MDNKKINRIDIKVCRRFQLINLNLLSVKDSSNLKKYWKIY